LFLLVFGWPLWLIIWGFRQKKKTGKFPWLKVLIIAILCIVLGDALGRLARVFQGTLDQKYGVGSIGGTVNGKNIDFK
jgi:hypothetical protein